MKLSSNDGRTIDVEKRKKRKEGKEKRGIHYSVLLVFHNKPRTFTRGDEHFCAWAESLLAGWGRVERKRRQEAFLKRQGELMARYCGRLLMIGYEGPRRCSSKWQERSGARRCL